MANIYQEITNKIIKQLENGEIPWKKPWCSMIGGAYNRVSKKPYSFLNQIMLEHDGEYATYNQWKSLGGQVRKGEKAEKIVFWKMISKESDNEEDDESRTIPILRYYNVFHISQVDGVEPLNVDKVHEHNPIETAEKIVQDYSERESLCIEEIIGDIACYSPLSDRIVVPSKSQYEDINQFYATLFHECVHSTGSHTRLKRFAQDTSSSEFDSESYSFEELIAEIGSAFLMNDANISTDDALNNSAAYIQGWLKRLKDNPKMIVSAAGRSEKAVNYILHGLEAEE